MTVMAGAMEIHAHVAGPKVNVGRWFRPEDKLFNSHKASKTTRIEGGFSIPTVFKTGYDYARMGYTFAMEAAMPPLYARHVHEEIHDTPIIDEAALPVVGNNWFIMEYPEEQGDRELGRIFRMAPQADEGIRDQDREPGGTEAWAWGLNCLTIHDPVPYFDITPAEIVKGLIETNEYLGLPHSVHIHGNNLGNPGNYTVTLDTLKLAKSYKPKNNFGRKQVMHATHVQFHSYGGDSWGNFESKAKEVMDYVNKQKNITIDTGNVTLDETTTMTADGPFEHHLDRAEPPQVGERRRGARDRRGGRPVHLQPEHRGERHPVGHRPRAGPLLQGPDAVLHYDRPPERRALHPLPAGDQVAHEPEGPGCPDQGLQEPRQGDRGHRTSRTWTGRSASTSSPR